MAFTAHVLNISLHLLLKGYGATAARQIRRLGVRISLASLIPLFALSMSTHTGNTKTYSKLKNPKKLRFGIDKPKANTANHCEPLYLEITTCSQQVPSFPSSVIGPFGPGCTCCKASMQWEGQSACVQVSASNEELQKMFAERERTAECRQKTLCPSG